MTTFMEEAQSTLLRACLFNLIIYTEDKNQCDYLHTVADMVIGKYPSRIIMISGDRKGTDSLKVEIKENPLAEDNPVTTWGRVEITASGNALDQIPLVILPYLIPDFPTYTLWGGNPTSDNPQIREFKKLSSRLIFDSETTYDLVGFSKKMLLELEDNSLEVVDINWARISGWRTILLDVFDSPEALTYLQDCKQIQINYNAKSDKVSSTQALYLQAWLASCLGWELLSCKGTQITYKSQGNEFQVNLVPKSMEKLPLGSILSFEVSGLHDQFVIIERKDDSPQVMVQVSTHDACDLPYTLYLPNIHRGSSYLAELLWSKTSIHYPGMLKTLAKTPIGSNG